MLMISTVLNFIAVTYLPLTLTSTILFSTPIIICMLSWPLLGERVGLFRFGAIALGFGGVAIAIRPFDDSFHWAVFLSLGGAFTFALYSILTRRLAGLVLDRRDAVLYRCRRHAGAYARCDYTSGNGQPQPSTGHS